MEADWNIVAERKPQGYIELNDGKEAIYGPVESVEVNEIDWVEVKVKWAVKRELGQFGIPVGDGKWQVVSNVSVIILEFPNFCMPFEIEETPEKGPRARFGLSILYFDDVQKVDPSEVDGLQLTAT